MGKARGIVQQLRARSVVDDAAAAQHQRFLGHPERELRRLLHQYNRYRLIADQPLHDFQQNIDDHRCQPLERLVEQLPPALRSLRKAEPGYRVEVSDALRALANRQMSGWGSMVSFELKGGKAAAFRVLNALRLIDISNNLGDTKSLMCHPATTTHQRIAPEERARMGIGEGLLRLSVGLEDAADLEEDLAQALRRA